jgi:hypothetical protein
VLEVESHIRPAQQSPLVLHVLPPLGIQQEPGVVAPVLVQPVDPVGHCVQVLSTQHPHIPFTHTSPAAVLHAPQLVTDEHCVGVSGHVHVPSQQLGVLVPVHIEHIPLFGSGVPHEFGVLSHTHP